MKSILYSFDASQRATINVLARGKADFVQLGADARQSLDLVRIDQ